MSAFRDFWPRDTTRVSRSEVADSTVHHLSIIQLNVAFRKDKFLTIAFLIYINDICNASEFLELVLFADDTNLFFSQND